MKQQTTTWKAHYQLADINWTKLAANEPIRGLVSSNKSGSFQLYGWDVPSRGLRQLTECVAGQRSGSISPDGCWIYFLQDQEGNEKGHYVRIPFEGGEPEDITPDMPPYFSYGLSQSPTGNRIGLSVVDHEGSHIYIITVKDGGIIGPRRKLCQSPQMAFNPIFSSDGKLAVIASTEPTGKPQYALLAFDLSNDSSDALSTGCQLGELWDGEGTNMRGYAFSPKIGDSRLLGSTNTNGFERPLIWNCVTGERTDVVLSEVDGNIEPVCWSPDGKQILLCQINQAVQQLYLYDLAEEKLIQLDHPSGSYETGMGTYFYSQEEIYTGWEDASHPPQLIALDATTGAMTRKVLVASESLAGHTMRSITFPSSDGQMVQGWLGVPEGEGPFPTVIDMHGGPEMAVMNWFDPVGQSWLDNGFAFLSLNYRGSTTFGNDFQQMIWGNVGHWEIEDMVAARSRLVSEGIAHPDQVFLSGGSYGGYLTLLGLGKHPDLWAGGLASAAIADWALAYEDTAETLRSHAVLAMGGTPEENPDHYLVSSPLTYVDHVAAPILIIQGRNDTRTPPRQVEVYVERLRALGKRIDIEWYDTGHTGGDMEQGMHHQAMAIDFARQVIEQM